MSAITTHILDTALGRPAAGMSVVLEMSGPRDQWRLIGQGVSDAHGRLDALMSPAVTLAPGIYRLVFDTRRYFQAQGVRAFHPHVIVTFEAIEGEAHYHVPLLLSPFGYTTYRGS